MTSSQIAENYQTFLTQYRSKLVRTEPIRPETIPVQKIITPVRTMPYIRSNRMDRALDDNEIRRYAPSVFADRPWSETSDEYRFLPTINVINALRDNGYNVVKAMQSRSRIEGKGEFTKHILRLRQNQYMTPSNVGDEIPELVLINSHDRTSSYKLMLGIFRLVCTNGMIVASSKIDELSVRHIGGARNLLKDVIDVSCRVIDEAPKVLNQINRFKSISLSPDEQRAFASSSIELLDSAINIKPEALLTARRYDDRGDGSGINNLWKTSNIIQENLIKGGIRGVNSKNRFMRTREVKCVAKNVNINKALWKLTEELAKIKS